MRDTTNQRNIYLAREKTPGMNVSRGRSVSLSSALASLPKSYGSRRSLSSLTGLSPRSVRVVVLGAAGVGKTAMSVRFVTKRFIGDYDPTLETIYRHTTVIDDQLVNFEIMDTAGQEDNSLTLEDKCKWGESFIFVYDVTDKYSFDELTRLKFIASYTHAKLRANFTPVWILVGNKTDLAERERMVSTEEGIALAQELGCHEFHEISVKESMDDANEVFGDLWRQFSRLSPRSPSSSHRRKHSCRIQDKISVVNSHACTCASEALKQGVNDCLNGLEMMSSLTNCLKRQTSVPTMHLGNSRQCKDVLSNGEEQLDVTRSISCIPENIEEDDEDGIVETVFPKTKQTRSHRNAVTSSLSESKPLVFLSFPKRKPLCKAKSVDNVYASVNLHSPTETSASFIMSSSTSSSNSSLNGSVSAAAYVGGLRMKPFDSLRSKGGPASFPANQNSDSPPNTDDMVSLYRDHCKRTRARRHPSSTFNRSLSISGCNSAFGNQQC